MLDFDVVVIGSGVAGMTASIYLKRANVNVCIVEKTAPGGQLNMIYDIKNYPGFKSIPGPNLAVGIFEQMRELGVPYKYGMVKEIVNENDKKIVKIGDEEITCKGVIIATGRRPRELNIQNEKKLIGNGISYCSICDGTIYKNKDVIVVGGGNSAIDSALYLSDIVNKVYLIHRSDFRAEKSSMDEINSKNNIEVITPAIIKEIKENDGKVCGVLLDNDKTIDCSCIFVNIGNVPIPVKCDGLIYNDNYIEVDFRMMTSVNNIYACGDIIHKDIYQISTAVGEATIAALNIIKDL